MLNAAEKWEAVKAVHKKTGKWWDDIHICHYCGVEADEKPDLPKWANHCDKLQCAKESKRDRLMYSA